MSNTLPDFIVTRLIKGEFARTHPAPPDVVAASLVSHAENQAGFRSTFRLLSQELRQANEIRLPVDSATVEATARSISYGLILPLKLALSIVIANPPFFIKIGTSCHEISCAYNVLNDSMFINGTLDLFIAYLHAKGLVNLSSHDNTSDILLTTNIDGEKQERLIHIEFNSGLYLLNATAYRSHKMNDNC